MLYHLLFDKLYANSSSTELYNTPLTISFWVSPSEINKFESVIFKPGEYSACIGNGSVHFGDGSGVGTELAYNLSNSKWYNIVLEYIGNNRDGFYINGKPEYILPDYVNGTWSTSANTLNMAIGSNQSSSILNPDCPGAGTFNGKIANVQLYKGNVTGAEDALLSSEGIGGAPIIGQGLTNKGWWPLNGNTNDYSGNGNNGVGSGSFGFAPPNVQTLGSSALLATNFNQSGSYVAVNTINNYADIMSTGSFTVTAWIKLNACTGWDSIAGDYAITGTGFQFYACTDPSTLVYVVMVAGQILKWPMINIGHATYPITSYPTGTWEMVTAEYNGSTGQATAYLNNILWNSTMLSPHLNLAQTVPFEIGNAYYSGESYNLNGSIANVQLYSQVLPQSEIDTLYNSGFYGMPRPNEGIVGWWPLNGNANDYSGNGNNGTMINTLYEYIIKPSSIPPLGGYGISSVNTSYVATANQHSYPHFSISYWAYLVQPVSGYGTYVSTSANPAYSLFRNSTAQGMSVGDGSAISYNLSTFRIDKWTYVTGTYNGLNITYYVNGLPIAKGTVSTTIAPGNLRIGPRLAGSLANIEYYNTSLTPGQVYQLYVNQLPATYTEQIPLSWGT